MYGFIKSLNGLIAKPCQTFGLLRDKSFVAVLVNLKNPITKESRIKGNTRIKKYHDTRYGERPLIAKNTTGPVMTPISLRRDERG